MAGKKKGQKVAKPPESEDQLADAPPDEAPAPTAKKRKERAAEIPWAKNPQWTQAIIDEFTNNDTLRRNLFSETTAEAKADGRPKTKHGKLGKAAYHGQLAKVVFSEVDNTLKVDKERVADYESEPARYAGSVGSHHAQYVIIA